MVIPYLNKRIKWGKGEESFLVMRYFLLIPIVCLSAYAGINQVNLSNKIRDLHERMDELKLRWKITDFTAFEMSSQANYEILYTKNPSPTRIEFYSAAYLIVLRRKEYVDNVKEKYNGLHLPQWDLMEGEAKRLRDVLIKFGWTQDEIEALR